MKVYYDSNKLVYFADTNVFLRFLLKDNPQLSKKAKYYFTQAKSGTIKIIVLSEILLEIEYVLRKVYRQSRQSISKKLASLIKSPYFEIEEKNLWISIIEYYQKKNLDLVDLLLFEKAKANNAKVLTFDQRLAKIKLDEKED